MQQFGGWSDSSGDANEEPAESEEEEIMEEEMDNTFCNTTMPQLHPADYIEQEYHKIDTSDDETLDEDLWYRTRATSDTDSLLLMGTAQLYNNVIDSAAPDGSVFNFSSVIRRTKTERGGRTTLFFNRDYPVPKIAGKCIVVGSSILVKQISKLSPQIFDNPGKSVANNFPTE